MRRYEFGPYELDVDQRSLSRGTRLITLPPKLFDILVVLVEKSDCLVTKAEIITSVWPDTIVEESNLTVSISRLRNALGDNRQKPKYILTLPRLGYRFIATVRRIDQQNSLRSVAVFPFKNKKGEARPKDVGKVLTESLSHSLSKLPNLTVVPESLVAPDGHPQIDPSKIPRKPDICWKVTGRIVQSGNDVETSAELFDTNRNEVVWSERYHHSPSDFEVLLSQIAAGISKTIGICISNETLPIVRQSTATTYTSVLLPRKEMKRDSKADLPSSEPRFDYVNQRSAHDAANFEDSEARQDYARGRQYWSEHTKEGLQLAIECFQRAIDLDTGFIPAFVAIVDSYLRLATNYFLPAEVKQTKLNDDSTNLPQTLSTHPQPLNLKHEWEMARAEVELKRAVDLKDHCPDACQWQTAYLFCRDLYNQATVNFKREQRSFWVPERNTPNGRELTDTNDADLQILCIVARDQIEIGNTEASYLVLNRWYKFGEWPSLEGLNPQRSADLLFTTGVLAGRLANSRQIPRGQTHAAALLNGAISLFDQLGLKTRVIECRSELGRCYDRQGMSDLARANYLADLDFLSTDYPEVRSRSLLRLAFSEMRASRLHESLARLNEAKDMALDYPVTTSFYHIQMATALGQLAIDHGSQDYFDLACQNSQQALLRSQAVGDHHRTAVLETNHGHLLLAFKNLEEAEFRLFRARMLFNHFSESRPELDEIIARLHLEMGQIELAATVIERSVNALESYGEEQAELAESLRTQGRILARLGRHREAKSVLDRAFQIAKECNDREGAGLTLLIILEEISEHIERDEQTELATTLRSMLSSSQRILLLKRVHKCIELRLSTPRMG